MTWKVWLVVLFLQGVQPSLAMDLDLGGGDDGGGKEGREKKGGGRDEGEDDSDPESEEEAWLRKCRACRRWSYIRKNVCMNPECGLWLGRLPGVGFWNSKGKHAGATSWAPLATPGMSSSSGSSAVSAKAMPRAPVAPPVLPAKAMPKMNIRPRPALLPLPAMPLPAMPAIPAPKTPPWSSYPAAPPRGGSVWEPDQCP